MSPRPVGATAWPQAPARERRVGRAKRLGRHCERPSMDWLSKPNLSVSHVRFSRGNALGFRRTGPSGKAVQVPRTAPMARSSENQCPRPYPNQQRHEPVERHPRVKHLDRPVPRPLCTRPVTPSQESKHIREPGPNGRQHERSPAQPSTRLGRAQRERPVAAYPDAGITT
jgi:hypothetical protein